MKVVLGNDGINSVDHNTIHHITVGGWRGEWGGESGEGRVGRGEWGGEECL